MAFSFEVDELFCRAHNEYLRDSRRLQTAAGVLGGILIVVSISVFAVLEPSTAMFIGFPAIIFAALCFAMLPVIPRRVGNPQELYDRYDLCPAVVAEYTEHDMTLLALVNTAMHESAEPRYALSSHLITSVPGVNKAIGAKVPSVAVTLRRTVKSGDYFDDINPMPIGWATRDRATLREAERAISPQQWKILESHIDDLDQVKKEKQKLLPLDQLS